MPDDQGWPVQRGAADMNAFLCMVCPAGLWILACACKMGGPAVSFQPTADLGAALLFKCKHQQMCAGEVIIAGWATNIDLECST